MAAQPITGNSFVCIGYTTQLYDATASGAWSSSDVAKATVDGASGLVTGISIGSAVITYTPPVGSAATYTMNIVPVQISNGFNLARVYGAMLGRLGYTQPTLSGSPVLDSRNLSATSGRYFTEGHELVTVNNIHASLGDADTITDIEFNQYLQTLDQSALMRVLNAIFNKPCFIEHKLCYTRMAYQQNVLITKTQDGVFCGYRIVIATGDYAVVFNAISLFFNAVGTFNLYLFNDLLITPVKTQSVTTVANSQTKINIDWVVNYIQENNNGGVYYIGYFDTDLPSGMQAIDEQLNLWEGSSIWGGTPFSSPKVGALNFQRSQVGTTFYSYGLNVEMTAYRDYTEVIVKNPQLFDDVRLLAYAVNVLCLIKGSVSTNSRQRVLSEKDLNVDMNLAFPTQDFPFMAGIRSQLARAITSLQGSFVPKPRPMSVTISGGSGASIYGEYEGFNIYNLPIRQTLT